MLDVTHPTNFDFKFLEWLEKLRFEIGALETPGAYDDTIYQTQIEFEDYLWYRLRCLVISAQEKRRQ